MIKLSLRVWILIIMLFLALLAIAPWGFFEKGVVIKSVEKNSTAFEQGLSPNMIITSINTEKVESISDYNRIMSKIFPLANKTKIIIGTKTNEFLLYTDKELKITVDSIPSTNIRKGLDLKGGARALIKPEKTLSQSEMADLISVTTNRLNVYGLSDVTIKSATDLKGNNYMLVEIAGATPAELKELVAKQGKFEARIGNETLFVGGKKDITYVGRSGQDALIETCLPAEGGEICRFRFAVYLSEDAAKRHANITSTLKVNITESGRYLDKKLDMYLDDNIVDSLFISEDLKGKVTTQIQIEGSGAGSTREIAIKSAQESMKKLQTILITGSLPYKLEVVKLDTISPVLGKEFTKNIIFLALAAFLAVSIVLFIRYRKIKITLSVILTMFSEAFITLGIAALIKWNLDAPSIAGIIVGMGTGVNDQIVIIDETVSNLQISIKERIKRALFIIFGAFFTIVAAMLPLFWAGAGLLRGFALTTILSVLVGILITRPAFANILSAIQKD